MLPSCTVVKFQVRVTKLEMETEGKLGVMEHLTHVEYIAAKGMG